MKEVNEILNDFEKPEKETSRIFSILTFVASILLSFLLVAFFYLMATKPDTLQGQITLNRLGSFIIVWTPVCLVFSGGSHLRKEPDSWFKIVGNLLTLLVFLFLIGWIMYYVFIEISRQF